jgi:hypothetical protein
MVAMSLSLAETRAGWAAGSRQRELQSMCQLMECKKNQQNIQIAFNYTFNMTPRS